MKKTINKLDTPREGSWSSQVNNPGFISKKASESLRYTIKNNGEWVQKITTCKASVALFDQLFLVESKVGDTSSRYCTEEKLIEQLDDLNNHVAKLALALDHSDSKNTNSDAIDAYSANSPVGAIKDAVGTSSFHTYFEPLRMHLVSQHDDGSDTSGFVQIGNLQKNIESAETTIGGWLAIGEAIAATSEKANKNPSP